MVEALDIQVTGIVQGVGFRPFVYRMAKKYLINGWVLNAADGVFIHAEGESKLLDEFVLELSDNAPAAAQVAEIELKEVPLEPCETFEIRFSDEAAVEKTTLVSPDLATCDDCLRELGNPNDRRYHYPFINCTNCGPRFTIIDKLPYDRKSTSMKGFAMCERCGREYADPGDRRFHAQPDACFECGPHVSFRLAGASSCVRWGTTLEEGDALFAEAATMLAAGKILAVKGLGGYHLVCDANNAAAVAELRRRKHREGKAFAVMVRNVEDARAMCHVNDVEESVLTSAQRPIVLLRKKPGVTFAPQLADGLTELGVMLAYTPVQHLLIGAFARVASGAATAVACDASSEYEAVWHAADACESKGSNGNAPKGALLQRSFAPVPMLVMTSGNLHDEPIAMNDDEAYERLSGIADAFLGNDRPILTRFDDSVVRVIKTNASDAGFAIQFIRRARGYAPAPLKLELAGLNADSSQPVIFAAGPEQKNTFAFLRGNEAFVSQHVGDMENADVYDAWLQAKKRFEGLFEMQSSMLACDMHPEYLSSKWAHDQAEKTGCDQVVEVQHHHAHVAAVMAEHGITDAVCGISFDGTGYGVDGCIWGGEVLLANLEAFERFANFAYVPMPGGAAAVKNPLRMAYGVLWNFDLLDHPAAQQALAQLGAQADVCEHMIEKGLNTPMTSSVGRLFDAASALLGVCVQPKYEGEGAVLLEAACSKSLDAQSEPGALSCEFAGFDESDANPQDARKPEEQAKAVNPSAAACFDEAAARERYAIAVTKNVAAENSTAQDTSVLLFDAQPTFAALLDDIEAGVPVPVIARRFHNAFVDIVVMAAEFARALYGIETVVLAGGVFMNRYLVEHTLPKLADAGFTAAISRDLPPNDGSISLGQAVIAWAKSQTA